MACPFYFLLRVSRSAFRLEALKASALHISIHQRTNATLEADHRPANSRGGLRCISFRFDRCRP